VYCRCETNASQSAAAYAKLHGTLGCCIATSGPGASHLLSGIIDADQDRVPLLCLTGMKSLGKTRHSNFQDIDQSSIFRMAGLALSEMVSHIDQLLPLARNAFTAAIANNRCAHLAIPIDVQTETIEARTHFCLGMSFQLRTCLPASTLQVEAFAMALCQEQLMKRRVLVACGYRANAIGTFVERIAELIHAPILT
jgi:thiamine pyrophosphate-dependent acetolactate synthase large subunit-like protein